MREARFRAVDSLISEHPTLRDASKNGSTASVQAHLEIGDKADSKFISNHFSSGLCRPGLALMKTRILIEFRV